MPRFVQILQLIIAVVVGKLTDPLLGIDPQGNAKK